MAGKRIRKSKKKAVVGDTDKELMKVREVW